MAASHFPIRSAVRRGLAAGFVTALLAGILGAVAFGAAPDSASIEAASRAYDAARFAEAAQTWNQAATRYEQKGDRPRAADALAGAAAAEEGLGNYPAAVEALKHAVALSDAAGAPELKIELAQAYTLARSDSMGMSYLPEARKLLDEVGASKATTRPEAAPLRIALYDTRGALDLAGGDPAKAAGEYHQAVDAAEAEHQPSVLSRAAANAAVALLAEARSASDTIAAGNTRGAAGRLAAAVTAGRAMNERAFNATGELPACHDSAFLLLTIGQTDENLAALPPEAPDLRLRAYASYQRALQMARQTNDALCESYALGYTGHLYEIAGRRADAERLTRQALFLAEKLQAPSPLYLWQWQTARLVRDDGDRPRAIAAYQDAVATLRSIQVDLSAGGGNMPGRLSFRQAAGDVYYELADLLLSRAAADPVKVQQQLELADARDTVEKLKTAELENYLQDRCERLLEERKKGIESLDRHTAVIYYVPLADRVEILLGVSPPAGQAADKPYIVRFKTDISAKQLTAVARRFRVEVRDQSSEDYFADGQSLYKWLIAPVEPYLAARSSTEKIDTLVFVPDGALRSIPMAALTDEQGHFLIEHYAVAVSPGLRLTDPGNGDGGAASGGAEGKNVRLLINGLAVEKQGFPALKFVPEEIRNINRVYRGRGQTLLNQDFNSSSVDAAMQKNSYSIVHIASHGHFGGEARDTFVLAYDRELDLDELERLIEPSKFRDRPVDLLTLSACETAAGDDRAALGLAGVAVKAGALSAMATLWSVNDQSSATLIPAFYSHLQDPDASKAKALQRAQLLLLNDKRYSHPYFWSPYLIVGNWL